MSASRILVHKEENILAWPKKFKTSSSLKHGVMFFQIVNAQKGLFYFLSFYLTLHQHKER